MHKPRTLSLAVELNNAIVADALQIDTSTWQIDFLNNGEIVPISGKGYTKLSYPRSGKTDKTLSLTPFEGNLLSLSRNQVLFEYDQIFAIDTNNRQYFSDRCSMTTFVQLIPKAINKGSIKASMMHISMEFWNIKGNPENHGWHQLIKIILENQEWFPGKVCIITDSDLGSHEAINQRKKPYYHKFMLPEDITLLYASDKNGLGDIANWLIRLCDKSSNLVLNKQRPLLNPSNLQLTNDPYHTYYRQWQLNDLNTIINKR